MAIAAVASLTSCNIEKLEEATIITKPAQENFDDIYAHGWVEREGQTARLTLSFEAEEQVSRSAGTMMERTINDINIYLFSESFENSQRLYLDDSRPLLLPITPGDWRVYAIANYGENMGDKSESEVRDLCYEINGESDLSYGNQLIMTHKLNFCVDDTLSLSLLLSRAVARIDVSVTLTSEATESVTLQSIRLVNAPKRHLLFGEEDAPMSSDLITYENRDCSDKSSFSIYMLENLSGENAAITDESEKCEANAPETAAYLEITATTTDAWVVYRIYLGRNNISDFNVDRNTIYQVEASIYGAESDDMRVDVTYFPMTASVVLSGAHLEIHSEQVPDQMFASVTVYFTATVKLSRALKYDVSVMLEPLVYSNGTYTVPSLVIADFWRVEIPAGATQASATLIHNPIFANTITHGRLKRVITSTPSDLNVYEVNTTPILCSSHTTNI